MFLTLYYTAGCHLCELAEDVVDELKNIRPELQSSLAVIKVDIADDPALVDKFGLKIPVLQQPSADQSLDWPFDVDDLMLYLSV